MLSFFVSNTGNVLADLSQTAIAKAWLLSEQPISQRKPSIDPIYSIE